MNCWHCNTELIWGGDHDTEDNEDYDIVSNLSCPKCHTAVGVWHPSERLIKEYEEDEKDKKYYEKDKERIKKLSGRLGETRKEIVDMESNYASLFNHTADSRAQNKAVTWYLLNLSYLRRDNEDHTEPIFKGETFDDKIDEYYRLEEEGSELYDIISSRLATYISFWYYSAGAVTDDDFQNLQKDMDEGNV